MAKWEENGKMLRTTQEDVVRPRRPAGGSRIGRSTPKPIRLSYPNCRLALKCNGTATLETLRQQVGLCRDCASYVAADKPRWMSIGEWLERR